MKTIYILDGSNLAFVSWEDCMKFMKKCNEEYEGTYSEVFIDEFHKYYIWEEEE